MSQTKRVHHTYINKPRVIGVKEHMTLEFREAVKALEDHIEILKQNLLFLMAERKPESMTTTQAITIKRELDKAVQERMKLNQIYCRHNSSNVAVPATSAYYNENNSCYDVQQS
jgi:hypothetical protein